LCNFFQDSVSVGFVVFKAIFSWVQVLFYICKNTTLSFNR
jgi:hypothetical protein